MNRAKLSADVAMIAVVSGVVILAAVVHFGSGSLTPNGTLPPPDSSSNASTNSEACLELSPSQLSAITIESVENCAFPMEKEAVGVIDYNEDLSVQVFAPYPGKILTPLANLGDEIQKGQPLFTIDSPDLIQAESTLISVSATFSLTSRELARAKDLSGTNGVSERELEQAASDQQTAEGALKAARDAMRLFGKTDAEIEQIAASRQIDPALVVRSPVNGRVTARNAQPGLLVQPGGTPASYVVTDLSSKWMVANVSESDSPLLRSGQRVQARVMAFGDRVFEGRISKIGAAVDSNTHRVMVRCEIADPKDELRSGMLTSFLIQVHEPVESIAIPTTGIVRNGDGTMAAWVTTDRRHFTERIVKLGLQKGQRYQVLEGLTQGELAVTEGAVFLSNLLQAPPSD